MEDNTKEKIYESEVNIEDLNEEQEVVLSEEDVYFSGDLKVVSSENPYVLGKLVGTFMEIGTDNGNGRLYPLETIKTRVVELPYTQRMIKNKSLLGECHHPEERTNIWMDEACISTTKLEISPDGTKLMGEADILDTEKGRIVNTLARYGTNIGISARATGKGTKRNGHLVITPDKYFFKTFDAVLNPGFETARPNKLEPNGSPMQVYEEVEEGVDPLYEEIKSQIEQNKCDLKMLNYYINYSGDEKLYELQNLFEDASTDESSGDRGDMQMTEVEELKSQIEALNEENSKLKANLMNLTSDLDSLKEEKNEVNERLSYVNEELNSSSFDADYQVEELLDILYQQKNEIVGLTEELNDLKFRFAGLSSKNLSLSEELNEMEDASSELRSKVKDLYEENRQDKKNLSLLMEEINDNAEPEEPHIREKYLASKVDLFEESVEAYDVEQKKEKSKPASDIRQVNLIKSLGGK